MTSFSIELLTPDHWERFLTIRLRALAESPDAFCTRLAAEEARPIGEWRTRIEDPTVAHFLAVNEASGSDVGLVVGVPWTGLDRAAGLVAMWVAPEARGKRVGSALVDAVKNWARESGYEQVFLEVADDNESAIGMYESCGFVPTGKTGAVPAPRDHITEHERVCAL